MRIMIAGAGVGRLATAMSLHAARFTNIEILEVAPEVEPPGLGLNILPNAVRELTELNITKSLAAHAIATSELRLYHRCGELIWQEARGRAAGSAATQCWTVTPYPSGASAASCYSATQHTPCFRWAPTEPPRQSSMPAFSPLRWPRQQTSARPWHATNPNAGPR
jgi:hypothetical protein